MKQKSPPNKTLRNLALSTLMVSLAGFSSAQSAISATVRPFVCGGGMAEIVPVKDKNAMGWHDDLGYCRITNNGQGKCGYVVYNFGHQTNNTYVPGNKGLTFGYKGADVNKLKFRFIMKPHLSSDHLEVVDLKPPATSATAGAIHLDTNSIKVSSGLRNVVRVCVFLEEKGTVDLGDFELFNENNIRDLVEKVELFKADCSALEPKPWNAPSAPARPKDQCHK